MKNPYLDSFSGLLQRRFAQDRESMSYSDWIQNNTRLRKRPFSFKGYEFQRQICDDMHPDLNVIKLSQVGLTEIQLRKFLAFMARNTAVSGIFTLPDDNMFKRVSQTRAKPLVESEKVFNLDNAGEKPIRSMGLYQIGQSFAYFTGNKESDATSIPADILFHDEVDLSDQQMLGLFQSRLQNSKFKLTHKFSTPTYIGFGIDASFNSSDQHEWMCRCSSCNHWNLPDFTIDMRHLHVPGFPDGLQKFEELDEDLVAKIDFSNSYVKCERCHEPLDLGSPDHCAWVPKYPGRLSRGYRVRVFSTANLDIKYVINQLLKMKQADNLKGWYNTVLGQAYNDSNARLDELNIRACMQGSGKQLPPPGTNIILGCDVGNSCHITLAHMAPGDVLHVFDWRIVSSENLRNEINAIGSQYNIVGGCIDRYPYTPTANEIRDDSRGTIAPTEYRGQKLNIVNDEFDNFSHIQANRTQMMDAVRSAINKRKYAFTGFGGYENMIVEHLRDMVRIETPEKEATWEKLTGNDHWFHSLGFLTLTPKFTELKSLEDDPRMMTLFANLGKTTKKNQNEPRLGSVSRIGTTMSLGTDNYGR